MCVLISWFRMVYIVFDNIVGYNRFGIVGIVIF